MTYKAAKTFAITTLLATQLLVLAEGQDRSDWQSPGQLRAGDSIHLSLKTVPSKGAFQNWIPTVDLSSTGTSTQTTGRT
jgi:hypothetical protein